MTADREDAPPDLGELPVCPQVGPYAVPVVEGTTYRWCSCGLSATQPWCDDAHLGTAMAPITFVAPISATFYMCGCKRSDNAPYCFGNCRGHHLTAAPRRR